MDGSMEGSMDGCNRLGRMKNGAIETNEQRRPQTQLATPLNPIIP